MSFDWGWGTEETLSMIDFVVVRLQSLGESDHTWLPLFSLLLCRRFFSLCHLPLLLGFDIYSSNFYPPIFSFYFVG